MVGAGARFHTSLRWGILAAAAALTVTASAGNADARSRHHHRHRHGIHAVHRYHPPSASIVVDVNSGKVLEASNPDSPRHPASLTKMMTLYLLFERLAADNINLNTEMKVSAHAAAQAPTKLGLKAGQTLTVGDAIKGIVTESANDAAVVVAEALGGSELNFAKEMTAKAQTLGMLHTNYHNASGLPDNMQITTARDQAILARALQDRFPQYFHYFSTRSFIYHGRRMRNHNHLLGRINGVDGIKTGYIRESGFNIAVDVHRGGHHIVVVVFGGRTARARDARVVDLIDDNIDEAAVKRTSARVVEGWKSKKQVVAATPLPPVPPQPPGSTAPIKPKRVKVIVVRSGSKHTDSRSRRQLNKGSLIPPIGKEARITIVDTIKQTSRAPLPGKPVETVDALPTEATTPATELPTLKVAPETAATLRNGWMIQVGAFDDETDAKQHLSIALDKAKAQLGAANPFTEPVAKGDKMLFRARFAGLDKTQAEAACRHLKHRDVPCMVVKN